MGDAFHYISTLDNILQKEIERVKGNKSHIDNIVPKALVNIYSQKRDKALEFADSLSQTAYESSVVTLLAAFERILFTK
jgi:hypothetical protein